MMIRSMTGFGAASSDFEMGEFSAEVRSVNNRYLDVVIRLPRDFSVCESMIRDIAKTRVQRGKCEINVRWNPSPDGLKASTINVDVLRGYCQDLEKQFGQEFVRMAAGSLLRMPGVCESEDQSARKYSEEEMECLRTALFDALNKALDQFAESRVAEGTRLVDDLRGRIVRLGELCEAMSQERERVLEDFVVRLRDRATELGSRCGIEYDANRLEMEIVTFADRCYICEELIRLQSHLQAFLELVDSQAPDALVGKSLDFVVQEMMREATTASNKCRSKESSALCVEMKTEIEKIREQVQNLA